MHSFLIHWMIYCALIISVTTASPETKSARDWPQWRGLNQDGKSLENDVFSNGYGLDISWKHPLGQGYSSVSIADGRAVTMFTDGTSNIIIAFDAATGNELWRHMAGPMYVGQGGSHNGPSSTPLLNDGKVFALDRKGKLMALDAQNGREIWSRNIVENDQAQEPFHGFTTTPMVSDNVLIVETGGNAQNTISGFNKNTGELLWQNGNDVVEYHSPVAVQLGGEKQVICSGKSYLYGLNPVTGEKRWEYHHEAGGNSSTPILIENDRLLFQGNFRESQLLQVTRIDGSYQVQEVWKTRDLRQSWNVPIYHEGHLYGYSGRFLNCVDVRTGKTVWKSRPPGDGFLILVDEHLVILTKRGTLHIAEASAEDYREKANIKLFEGLAWSPPSFADGRIYARSLSEIASVSINPAAAAIQIVKKKAAPVAPGSKFANFVKKAERASDKSALIDEFMAAQTVFPVIEGENLAHIVYRGEVRDLVLSGDMFEQNADETMIRLADTDFYYYTLNLEPDAHLGYQFVRNFDERIPDPLNPRRSNNFNGEESELIMPGTTLPDYLTEKTGVARGVLKSASFESKVMAMNRELQIYLPAGYAQGSRRYPVVYVNDGKMAVDFAKMPVALDNLIAEKRIQPVIAVFIQPSDNRFQEYARNEREKYARMVAEELTAYIDRNYRTLAKPEARLLMGGDEGGFSAIFTAFEHPGVFGNIAGQSSHLHSAEGDELRATVKAAPRQALAIYLDWGTYDYRSQTGGYSWRDNNRNFVKILESKGYPVTAVEVNQGFGWTSWRTRTDRVLETFFDN